ncbi:polysaccharide biosynthesis tyrosine autokinase [Comamonadaceae bacterium PP-2]
MNTSLNQTTSPTSHRANEDGDELNFTNYFDILLDSKWLITGITASALAISGAYALLTQPVYESNLLIQVEDSSPATGAAQNLLGSASSLFDVKTPATGEIEIIRSRMVIGRAVDAVKYYIHSEPKRIPFVGNWLSDHSNELSTPINGWVRGIEAITAPQFEVPPSLEGETFIVKADGKGGYTLSQEKLEQAYKGSVGELLEAQTKAGPIKLLISKLEGLEGADFTIIRSNRIKIIDDLQDSLAISERGRQSGIVNVSLQSTNTSRLIAILNEIGLQYVRQNIERKSAEAEKTLTFLSGQLPDFKKQLENAEEGYNRFRNQNGTIALDEEAKLALQQTVELQTKLFEAQQEKRLLESKFTGNHPTLQTLNRQIAAWQGEIVRLNSRIRSMPTVQQDAMRFQRDIQVNTELYQAMLNNALQLQLVKEGKTGNVRLLDDAVISPDPVKPRKGMIVLSGLILGLLAGFIAALIRNTLSRGLRSSVEIESQTGLNVYSIVPLSSTQKTIAQLVSNRAPGVHLLANSHSADSAIESLRSLRTALQFAMLEAPNNRILITGATPGLGKSFISTNFAAVLAAGGKRVLLIDADMRKGYINQFFGLDREGGLSNLLVGAIDASKAIRHNVLPNLDILPTGTFPPNPAELLMSDAFAKILNEISVGYDMVVIDTAPVLVAADTAAAARHAGIVLLVARFEQTNAGELTESGKRLAQSGSTVNGVIFNGVDTSKRYTGAYGYKYGGYRYANYEYAPQSKT